MTKQKLISVLNTIEGAIAESGGAVVNELGDFHHGNRVYVVGGGAPLIIWFDKNGMAPSWAKSSDDGVATDSTG